MIAGLPTAYLVTKLVEPPPRLVISGLAVALAVIVVIGLDDVLERLRPIDRGHGPAADDP